MGRQSQRGTVHSPRGETLIIRSASTSPVNHLTEDSRSRYTSGVVKRVASEPGHRDLQKEGSVWSRIQPLGIHARPEEFLPNAQQPREATPRAHTAAAACFRVRAFSRLAASLCGEVRICMRSFQVRSYS